MARKTRTKKHSRGLIRRPEEVMTIPEVRRSFEHMEEFIHECHTSGNDHTDTVDAIRKEWSRVFGKVLSKAAAEDLLAGHITTHRAPRRRHTRKRGGSHPLGYSPIDGQMRAGEYSYSSQGGMGSYFTSGLSVGIPEKGMTAGTWPTVPKDMGTNSVPMKGGRRSIRRRGGASIGALISQAFDRPAGGSAPPSILMDARTIMNGQLAGGSPNQMQQSPPYQSIGNTKPISF